MPRAKIVPKTAFAALLSLAGGSSMAQDSGSAPAPPAASSEASPIGDVLLGAACSVGRDVNAGTAMLATTPFSAEERTAAGNFMRSSQRCLRRREPLLTPAYVARASAAEAMYEVQFATPPAARTPALGASPLTRPGADLTAETLQRVLPMYGLADCAAARQPDLIRAVLATEPRGPEEGAALTALHPAFGACVPAGTRLTYDPRVIRGLLAEALYRWTVVQRDGPASPWAAAPAAPAPSGQ